MRYEIIYRYKSKGWLDVRYEYSRCEGEALIKFWTFVRNFRDINDIELVRIDEKEMD